RLESVEAARAPGEAPVPTTIALERNTNIFMRARRVAEWAQTRAAKDAACRALLCPGAVSTGTRRAGMRLGIMLAPLLLGACAGSYEAPRLTEKQTAELEKALAGKVPGEKVSCVTMRPQGSFRVISGNIVLYRMSSKLIYKNELI